MQFLLMTRKVLLLCPIMTGKPAVFGQMFLSFICKKTKRLLTLPAALFFVFASAAEILQIKDDVNADRSIA